MRYPVSILSIAVVFCGGGAFGCSSEPRASVSAEYEGDEPGECEDGADNDRDGTFDCMDPDCSGDPICSGAISGTDSEINTGNPFGSGTETDGNPGGTTDTSTVFGTGQGDTGQGGTGQGGTGQGDTEPGGTGRDGTGTDTGMSTDTGSVDTSDTSVPVGGTIQFAADSSQGLQPISPYIYGSNQTDWQGEAANLKLGRLGGNRWTAYNWETNASNAGSDWNFANDGYLETSDTPGEAVRSRVQAAHNAGAAAIITVPIAGYVASDKDGNVDLNDPNHLADRFLVSQPAKGSAFSLVPDAADDFVYQDEFVNWVITELPDATVFYSLDNEPDLWFDTHVEIHPEPVTYEELLDLSISYSKAIKTVDTDAIVLGFVSYGYNGFVNLQNASDSGGHGDFIPYFLGEMRQAGETEGYRLLDVLDLHWYPEASGGGTRIINNDNSDAVVEARVQTPRSLWDDTYVEDSWIASYLGDQPIVLLPTVLGQIDEFYPGTRLAITEYNYGGYGHISGGIAQADVLGILGKYGVFAATLWHLNDDQSFHYAAFDMYLNYDGAGGSFGDTAIHASTSDVEATSFYAGVDEGDDSRMVLVAINKTSTSFPGSFTVTHGTPFTTASVYSLTAAAAAPQVAGNVTVMDNQFSYELPSMSVTTFELTAQ